MTVDSPSEDIAPNQVQLPDLPELRAWIDATKQKRQRLQDRAERLREEFEPLRKKLAGVERSIKVLDHFLKQVSVEPSPESTSERAKRPSLLGDRWSRKYPACRACGSSDKVNHPHKAQGYGKQCYDKHIAGAAPLEAVS